MSFGEWLAAEIADTLRRRGPNRALLFWCDPDRQWLGVLRRVAGAAGVELWGEEQHTLVLRQRLCDAPDGARVVWMPCRREQLGYCEVLAIQSAGVWTRTLAEALGEYGVELPMADLPELGRALSAYAEERLDHPLDSWKDLTVGQAEHALIGTDTVLRCLADGFDELDDRRFPVFARIAAKDYGLPAPRRNDAAAWRRESVARLLCTDVADRFPEDSSADRDRLIPAGPARTEALRLLRDMWLRRIDLLPGFERVAPDADDKRRCGSGHRAETRCRSRRLPRQRLSGRCSHGSASGWNPPKA